MGALGSPFLFWDGRKDSLWSQALGPLEDALEHGSNRHSFLLDPLASALFTIDQRQHTKDAATALADGVHGAQRGFAGRDHVFDDHDLHARLEAAFDEPARAVSFGLLAHGERIECAAVERGGVGNGVGNRIRAEREATERFGLPAQVVEQPQPDPADQRLPLSRHGGEPRIDVVGRALAAGQDELAETHGALQQQGA